MPTTANYTTRTDTFAVSPLVLAAAAEARAGGWKEVRGLDTRAAHELLATLEAAGCQRRQFAISGRDGTYVVRWV